jgi:hypothetical protein
MIERDVHGVVTYTMDGIRLHRANGPAILVNDDTWIWWLRGKWHRYYGPGDSAGCWGIHGEMIKR